VTSIPQAVESKGVGGFCTLSPSVVSERVNHSLIHNQNEDGVGTVLLALGVFSLSTPRREALASEIASAGITGQQLRGLESYIHEGEPDAGKARRFLTAIVCDMQKLRDAVDGLAKFRSMNQHSAQEKKDEGPEHIFNMPIGTPSCPCHTCRDHRQALAQEPWDHDSKCDLAACLAGGDRWSIERIAKHFEVTETTARAMVDRGNVLKGARQDKPKKKAKDDTTSEDRCKQFREAPRSVRLRLLRGDA